MAPITFLYISTIAVFHFLRVSGQVVNSEILQPARDNAQRDLANQACAVVAANGGLVDTGLQVWEGLKINDILREYLVANPPGSIPREASMAP